MLVDDLQILVILVRWCLDFLALPVVCRNTIGAQGLGGHLSTYEPDTFSAVSDEEVVRSVRLKNQKISLPAVDGLKRFIQTLADEKNAEKGKYIMTQ